MPPLSAAQLSAPTPHWPMGRSLVHAFHARQEGKHGASSGLCAVKATNGEVLSFPAAVENEISSFFEALFHGRHVASNLEAGPIDSGVTFQPDEQLFLTS
jgi:hypothetical protein